MLVNPFLCLCNDDLLTSLTVSVRGVMHRDAGMTTPHLKKNYTM